MDDRPFEKVGDRVLELLQKEEQLPGMSFFLFCRVAEGEEALSTGLQGSLQNIFPLHLTAKTWAALTKENERSSLARTTKTLFKDDFGKGILRRGGSRYQLLVPSYLVMRSSLVLSVAFVAEPLQGTMKRPSGLSRRAQIPWQDDALLSHLPSRLLPVRRRRWSST